MASLNRSTMLARTLYRHSTPFRRTMPLGWMYRSRHPLSATAGQATQSSEASKKPTTEAEGAEIPQVSAAEKDLQEKIAALTKENESLVEKVADYQDKYQRTLADRENVRTRLEKQISDAKQFGIQGFCKDLLEVSDVFRKAIDSVPEEKMSVPGDLKTLYDGLVMTETQLLSVFRRHGLEPVEPKVGDKFDPSLQEAMFEVPLPDHPPGTIAQIIRNGWTLHARCIRSAQVGVVKA